jgi:DNA-binding MarR family transcriptional regulator
LALKYIGDRDPVKYREPVPSSPSFDSIAEAHRQWNARWPEHADHMATVTSVMRVQQLLLSRIEETLKPYGLTFAAYEALQLLAFARGALPMGKMGERLMVHPASVTNVVTRLEQRGLVERRVSPDDRRVVLARITSAGQTLAWQATEALNESSFGLADLTRAQAVETTAHLRDIRAALGDVHRPGQAGTSPRDLPVHP